MTTIDTRPEASDTASDTLSGASRAAVGVYDWVTTADHKRIGRLFTGFSLLALIGVAVLGVIFGIERSDDAVTNFDADALLQLIQGYRVGLIFAVVAPLSVGLSLAVVPLQVGARTMAFPRVALTGFYAWLGGLALTYGALVANGGIGGGNADMVDLFLAGQGLMIVGLLAAFGALAATVLTTRAPGMTMWRIPVFSWASLVAALGALMMLPVAFGVIIYLFVDHRIADQLNFGGSEGIEAWLGWVWSTPAVIIFAVPALGLFADLVAITFRHRQAARGTAFTGIAWAGVIALAALTQQRTITVNLALNQDFGNYLKGLIPFLILDGLPILGLLVLGGTIGLTARGGRPAPRAPFVFGLFAVLIVEAAFVGNLLLSIENLDLAGTAFEEGVVVLAVYGMVIAVMGGLVLWAPKLSGKLVSDAKAIPVALLGVAGAVLAGGAMLVAGALGQAGGVPNNDAAVANLLDLSESAPIWNLLALVGHGLMAVAILGFIGLILTTVRPHDEPVPENPYNGHSLEWMTLSPAPEHNYEYLPAVSDAEPAFEMSAQGTES